MDDKAAFDRMFNEWYAQFVYFAYYFVNDVEVCRDIVSDAFEGMRKVQRHQKLYQLFADDLKNGIHALALHLYTKSEWESLGKAFPKSPNCLGVGQ